MMPGIEPARRFEVLFSAYFERPREELLASIAELGEELVQARVPPEEIAEIFEGALLNLSQCAPHVTLRESVDRISLPLVEMLIAYGLAFREQLSRQQIYEETKLAAKVIENVYEGIWVADRKGEILIANPALQRILGFGAEEMKGRGFSLICGEESNSALTKRIWEDVREAGSWRGELTLRRKDGAAFPALVTLGSIQDEDGTGENVVGVLDDLSEQKLQAEIRALEIARAKQIYELVIQPKPQVVDGARISMDCLPAENIGGDVLLIEKIDAQRFLVFLADVTGHGVPAAMTANSIKMLVKEIARTDLDPGVVSTRLNKAICGNVLPDDIVAAFCGLIDLERGFFSYCLAGLPAPVILRAGQGIRLEPTGPPLGVLEGLTYGSSAMSLVGGDLFLIFTDGITEARDAQGVILGGDGVLTGIMGMELNAATVTRELLRHVGRHQQSRFFSDDVILMAIQVLGDAAPAGGEECGSWSRFSTDTKCVYTARTRDIQQDDLIAMVMGDVLLKCSLNREETTKLKVALFEVLSNAIEHGNLQMTKLKRDPDLYDTEGYRRVFEDRLNDPAYGGKHVAIECLFRTNEVHISVEDEGEGFELEAVADPTCRGNLENHTGRGIRIARMAVDNLTAERRGSRITITKRVSEHFMPE